MYVADMLHAGCMHIACQIRTHPCVHQLGGHSDHIQKGASSCTTRHVCKLEPVSGSFCRSQSSYGHRHAQVRHLPHTVGMLSLRQFQTVATGRHQHTGIPCQFQSTCPIDMCVGMYAGMCVDMYAGMCAGAFVGMCRNIHVDMCGHIHLCRHSCRHVCGHVYSLVRRYVWWHVCGHVRRHVCGHVCRYACRHVCGRVCRHVCRRMCRCVRRHACTHVCKH